MKKVKRYRSTRKYRCPYCNITATRDKLAAHIEDKHEAMIPEGYTATRVLYDYINKKNYGTCLVCKKKVYEWDDNVCRYKNICDDPKCLATLKERAGHNHLEDPEVQKKLLAGRRISGQYTFHDGVTHSYVGSYERNCFEFMDTVLNIPGKDIMSPGPTIYYEYKADGITSTDAIKGTYLDNYKNIWDLYINNATCEPSMISSKTAEDARAEFALGEAVFYQNGTWETNGILEEGDLTEDDLGMLPIYIGVEGEENQGLCTGSENYWCVNAKASEEDIQATVDFLTWCITSDEGRTAISKDMGFATPFTTFGDDYAADNVLVNEAAKYVEDGKTPVTWCFTTMPSENWKNGVGSALLEYAQGTGEWDSVVTAFVDGWATEYAAANAE